MEILSVGGQEGAALRRAQVLIIRDLLQWAADENTDTT